MSEKLKPCPFCGGTLIRGTGYQMESMEHLTRYICSNCDASTGWHNSTEAARRAWNKRAGDERPVAI